MKGHELLNKDRITSNTNGTMKWALGVETGVHVAL